MSPGRPGPVPDVAALLDRSAALQAAGRIPEALALLTEARARHRQDPDLAFALGNLARLLGRAETAMLCFREAARAIPDSPRILNNLADAQRDLGKLGSAEISIAAALALADGDADLWNTAGHIALDRGDLALARERFGTALVHCPDHALALTNLAEIEAGTGRHAAAVDLLDRAVVGTGATPQSNVNLAYSLFALGRYAEAWQAYAARFDTWRTWTGGGAQRRPFDLPLWRGEPLAPHRLLVWAEQGVGDELLYASMLPDLQARQGSQLLECAPRLVPLFRRSFPGLRVVARQDPPDPACLAPELQWQLPLAGLGALYRPREADFPAHRGYLAADPGQVATLRARYRAHGSGPLIGISWRSKRPRLGDHKTIALTDWAPILTASAAVFVNLQYGDCANEIDMAAAATGIRVVHDPEIDPMQDLDGFAAQTAAMDLVITVSNTTAHMAGALGVPTWTLLARGPGLIWYWLDRRTDSPWYPSMSLYRQAEPGQWAPVLGAVGAALRARAS